MIPPFGCAHIKQQSYGFAHLGWIEASEDTDVNEVLVGDEHPVKRVGLDGRRGWEQRVLYALA